MHSCLRYALFFVGIFHIVIPIAAVSLVYNFRVAQLTRRPVEADKEHDNARHDCIMLFFDQYQNKYCGDVSQNFLGLFGSYIYNWQQNYVRVDAAFAEVKEKDCGAITYNKTRPDDVLVTCGHNFFVSDYSKLTLSMSLGVPTRDTTILRHVDFGYAQAGLELQLDGFYKYNQANTIFYGTRYIYFVPRTTFDKSLNTYTYTIGNFIDLLVSHKHHWDDNSIEIGLTERWDFGSWINPFIDQFSQQTNYARINFYMACGHRFIINGYANSCMMNISYGFDQTPKQYGNKNVMTFWFSWDFRF